MRYLDSGNRNPSQALGTWLQQTIGAYVGSANLTESGVSSLHVEAGIAIDNRGGDSTAILDEIASAVDSWFRLEPEGLHRVVGPDDVERLTSEGILALSRPVRALATTTTSSGEIRPVRVTDRLRPLIRIPRIEGFAQGGTGIGEAEILRIVLAATPRIGLPSVSP